MQSELQQLLAQIDAEAEAAQLALYGSAMVASHDSILARQTDIASCYLGQLQALHDTLYPQEGKKK
jgi:hypothetical protein